MPNLQLSLQAQELAAVVRTSLNETHRLGEMTKLIMEHGISGEVTDRQLIALVGHQTALAVVILAILNKREILL